jgi:hypothetical protein
MTFNETPSLFREVSVVYQVQYGNYDLWARPLKIFVKEVEVDGKRIPRFEYLKG